MEAALTIPTQSKMIKNLLSMLISAFLSNA